MLPGHRRQVGRGVGDGLHAGFFIKGNGDHGRRRRLAPGRLARAGLFILQHHLLVNHQHLLHFDFKVRVPLFEVILDLVGLELVLDF